MLNISSRIRDKIYDQTNPQRLLLVTDDGYGNYIVISNEDISVTGGATFILSGINTQPFMFGCTPMSTMKVDVCNHLIDGTRRYRSGDLGNRKYKAFFGIQEYDDVLRYVSKYRRQAQVVAACRNEDLEISVLSDGSVVGNRVFGAMVDIGNNMVAEAKIAIVFDTIYLWYKLTNNTTAEYKIRKTGDYTYGDMEQADPAASLYMKTILDTDYMSVAYGVNYMEFGHQMEDIYSDYSTWGEVKELTWSEVKDEDWGKYSGLMKYDAERYYCIPFGVWKTDMPRHVYTDIVSLTAYDNMSVFDVDSYGFCEWIKGIRPAGLITCKQLVQYLCQYLGLNISSISNFSNLGGGGSRSEANLLDPRAYAQMKTCKDILSYALEVGQTNGLIDRNGCFKTYHSLVPGETNEVEPLPYVYTTDIAEFPTPAINKVLVAKDGDVSFYSIASGTAGDNVYEWSDNPYFNSAKDTWWSGSDNVSVLSGYYDAIITSCANYALWCDDVYSVTIDGITYTEPIFEQTIIWNAHGTVTYSNYGCAKREQQSYDQRESGVVNGNTKSIPGDQYDVIVGDSENPLSNRLILSNTEVRVGNGLSLGTPDLKRLSIKGNRFELANGTGSIVESDNDITFNHSRGMYKFEGMNTALAASNLYIDAQGQIFRITSLRKNKSNIRTIDSAWNKVDNLRGVSFTAKSDPKSKPMYGFIAEEVEKAVPELAEYNDETLSSVQYDRFTALLIEDCKESHKRIRDLEKRLSDLEGRVKHGE